jgi:hypothetical protein
MRFIDPDGMILKPYDDGGYSKTQQEGHFNRIFNQKTANLLISKMQVGGIDRKELRAAMKGMSGEQKALARGYAQMINSDKTVVAMFGKDDTKIPDKFLFTNAQYSALHGKTFKEMSESGGAATTYVANGVNRRAGADKDVYAVSFINTDFKAEDHEYDVLNNDGYSGYWENRNYVSYKEKGGSLDEIIAHEEIGHALYGGVFGNGFTNLQAIQVSNIFRIMESLCLRMMLQAHLAN